MNASGRIVRDALGVCRLPPEAMLVVCDSLDLSPGSCRLRLKGSSGGHKGLESVIRHMGTTDFMRLLIGIGRPDSRQDVITHVLGSPGEKEAALIGEALARAADAVLRLGSVGPEVVMNELNRREPPS
jgi:PTH1 family peptidyl-tRNA hydrolase